MVFVSDAMEIRLAAGCVACLKIGNAARPFEVEVKLQSQVVVDTSVSADSSR